MLVMKKVYTSENSFLVHNAKNLIEAQGIHVVLKNEFAQGAMGEISPFDCWPELWVNEADFAEAELVITEASLTANSQEADWVCASCGEENSATFEICWSCQKAR